MSCSASDGLHAFIVLEFPLAFGSKVLIVEVTSAALSPSNGLHLCVAVEPDRVGREELVHHEKEGRIECEPKAPIDLHFILYLYFLII